jgi:hypothetical protein
MSWDGKKPSLLNCARLMVMPPDAVYRELQNYGRYLDQESYGWFRDDKELEKQLFGRADPLINLGLAEFGGVKEIAAYLWKEASQSGGDEKYKAAIRLALLRNPHRLMGFLVDDFAVVPKADLAQIIQSDNRYEIEAVITNPGAKKLLDELMNRKEPFNSLSNEKFLSLLYAAGRSPCLTDDDSSEHGPDLYAMHIQKGIVNLLETYPVSEDSLEAFHMLLSSINPDHAAFPDKDPRPMFNRWQKFQVSEKLKKKYEERAGERAWRDTSMDFKDEFICLMASLYGVYMTQGKAVHLGSLDDPDPVMRYCHYGRTTMNPVDMEIAWNKDAEAFIFAVLHGYSVASDEQRAVIESHLRGPHQIRLYYKRLANSRWRKQEGDAPVRAVTPDGQELLESLSEYAEKPTQEMLRLQKIEQQIPALALQNARTLKSLQWVLVLLIVVLVVVIKRGWSYP